MRWRVRSVSCKAQLTIPCVKTSTTPTPSKPVNNRNSDRETVLEDCNSRLLLYNALMKILSLSAKFAQLSSRPQPAKHTALGASEPHQFECQSHASSIQNQSVGRHNSCLCFLSQHVKHSKISQCCTLM